ncbi:tetratricopeptide repeat protein [Psychroflexus sp. ALD_RP9]|uniref:tetratricopeptide repeat-containing sensor histidine kinase n=1 Tax=Psychroflexus sp. ALD_RP9 TaxID=2777186 RepID=UPI001A8C2D6B|nr:tetratricopeptide repeat protein [Psychroflexus sp. ALD_RP9]QSS98235.1 tetratricopeptide repeat protein [Psychroflexus sp. ALD_RP9]
MTQQPTNMCIKKFLVCLVLCITNHCLFASNQHPKIDSLKAELVKASSQKAKVDLFNRIAYEYIYIKYDSIKPNAEKAISIANKINYEIGIADARKNLATFYFFDGNRQKSFKSINQAISFYKKIKDSARIAKAYNNLANLYKNFGLLKESLKAYDSAIYFNTKVKSNQGLFNNYYNIGGIYLKQGDLNEALKNYNVAKEINKTLKDKGSRGSVLSGLGLVYTEQGKFDSAVASFQKSLKIFKEVGRSRDAVAMANNLADIERKRGNYLNSIEYFDEALDAARAINNPRMEAILLLNLANNYLELNDNEKALELYQKSAKIIKGIDDYAYAAALTNIAMVVEEDKPNEALQIYKTAYEVYLKMDSKPQLVGNLNNQANNLFGLGRYQDSKNTYLKAKKLLTNLNLDYLESSTFLGLSNASLALNQLDSAQTYADKALKLARKTQALSEEAEATQLLYKLAKLNNNYKTSLEYLELHRQLKDSLFNQDKSRELGKLEAELEFKNLKEQLQLERNQESVESELKLNLRRNFIIGLSIILIGTIIIIILLLILKKNQAKANQQLESYSKEIELRNNKLQKLHTQKNRLISIISHDFRQPLTNLDQILSFYLSKKISKEEFDQWLPKIKHKLDSTQNLISNLLKWAKQSINEFKLNKTTIGLHDLTTTIINDFNQVIESKQLKIINQVPTSLNIYIDKNTLELCLRNLISNAIKFCEKEDKIIITASQNETHTRVCIEDTGIGMSEQTAKNLFDSDDIISAIGTSQEKGSGIGAVLCKSFIEENDGKIWVEYSKPNQGTKICFEVPVKTT